MSNAGVRMTPAVRAALGADGVSRAEAVDLATAYCTECGRALPPAGPVTVQLARAAGGVHHLGYAHPGCAPSRLIELQPGATTAPWPTAYDMVLDALVLTTAAGPRAALLAQTPTTRTYTLSSDGAELRNVFAARLLEYGFGLMIDADVDPPRVGGWRVSARLVPGRQADVEITGPGGQVFYDGTADLNPSWCTATEGSRWCLLYVESDPVAWPDPPDPDAGLAALRRSAATGGLVAGRVPLLWDTAR